MRFAVWSPRGTATWTGAAGRESRLRRKEPVDPLSLHGVNVRARDGDGLEDRLPGGQESAGHLM